MILNRLDYKATGQNTAVGVGIHILDESQFLSGKPACMMASISPNTANVAVLR